MANYDAKLVISTTEAVTSITAVDRAAKALDATLIALSKTSRDNAAAIKTIADTMANVVKSEREAAAAVKERANATMAAAKADAQAIANQTKLAESAAKVASANAKTASEEAKAAAATSKAEAEKTAAIERTAAAIKRQDEAQRAATANQTRVTDARVSGIDAQTSNRAALSAEQLAAAQSRRVSADNAATASTERLNGAQERTNASLATANDNLSNSRYLLYDVAATYRTISIAMLAIPTATTAIAASYEKDFAQVLRTTTGQSSTSVLQLRDDLKQLATQIPLTFGELSNIASLGAQLGLGADQLANFTDVTAKFVATTNVSTDEAATAFGRLASAFHDQFAEDPSQFFNKIGSAISELGTNSVATDSDIVAVMNQLSPLGSVAGFTAQGIAGLSAALASVRIRPELARGSFQRIMSNITASAEQGSVAMETYAHYMGMTGQQALELQKSNPEAFFTQMIQGLGGALKAGVPFTTVLDDIGAKSVRDKQFLLALANNTDVLTNSMQLANESFASGTYLDKSSGPVFQTLAASIKMLGSSLANLGDSIGGPALQTLADFVRSMTDAASGVRAFIDQVPGIKAIVGALMGFSAVAGVLFALKTAQAFALAGMVAFQQIAARAGLSAGMSLAGGLKQASITMLMMKGASREVATALVVQNGATRALAASTAQLAGTAASTTVVGTRFGGAMRGAGSALLSLAGGPIGIAIGAIALLGSAMMQANTKVEAFRDRIKSAMDDAGNTTADGMKNIIDGFHDDADKMNGVLTGLITGSADPTGLAAKFITTADAAKTLGVDLGVMGAAASGSKEAIAVVMDAISKAPKDFGGTIAANKLLEDLKQSARAADEDAAAKRDAASGTKTLADGQSALSTAIKPVIDMTEDETKQLDDLTNTLKAAVEEAFGFSDAQGAVQAALEAIGESLQKGGTDFTNYTEAGRDNLKNLKDILSSEAVDLGQQVQNMMISPQDAAATFDKFTKDLFADLASRGVDQSQIAALGEQARAGFEQSLNLNGGVKAIVKAQVDDGSLQKAKAYIDQVAAEFGTTDVTVLAKMEGGQAVVDQVNAMQQVVLDATGKTYTTTIDANTASADGKILSTGNFLLDLVLRSWIMPVEADTNPAVTALRGLAQFAASVMNSLIDKINHVASIAARIPGMGWAKNVQLGHVGWGDIPAPVNAVAAPRAVAPVVAPTQTAAAVPTAPTAAGIPAPSKLGSLADGYDKAAAAAEKAGKKGKKAGKDMANGIDDATKAVNDYASRLKQGLQSAFDKQYGMQTATDEYYKALNAIADKRKEDLKSLSDMVDKQKELNNERNKDLVDARKAGIEKNISVKYGEVDRAADYGNQEKTALDNAAAKQKDIDATKASYKELRDGMGALNGYSNAAIANREALRGVESKMLDMISAYAATGRSQQEVEAYAKSLSAQFQIQTGQLGFNSAAVLGLQGDMGRYIATVRQVPERVNTDVSTSGVDSGGATGGGALGDLAAVDEAAKKLNTPVTVPVQITYLPVNDSFGALKGYREVKDGQVQRGVQLAYANGGQVRGFDGGGLIPGHAPSAADNLLASVDGKGLIKVRSEEFIQSAPAVKFWGLDFMNDINNMKMPSFKFGGSPSGASAAGASGGAGVVALDAATLATLQKLMDRPIALYADAQQLASTVNNGNAQMASRGLN